jgi:hypothetical protein
MVSIRRKQRLCLFGPKTVCSGKTVTTSSPTPLKNPPGCQNFPEIKRKEFVLGYPKQAIAFAGCSILFTLIIKSNFFLSA